jgi:hypothetical protein
MGYIRHHAVLVTSLSDETAIARDTAKSLGLLVSDIVDAAANGYASFFVAPDGSKEGWDCSDTHNERRERFVEWLRARAYNDGSSMYSWALVQYGDDNNVSAVLLGSDTDYAEALRARRL